MRSLELLFAAAVGLALARAADTKKDDPAVLEADLPHVACEVCNIVVAQLHNETSASREADRLHFDELVVMEIMDQVCDNRRKRGHWMLRYDVVQDGSYLKLEEMEGFGKCQHECLTLKRSCELLLEEEVDRDDVSGALWKGTRSAAELQELVCSDWSGRCVGGGRPKKKVKGRYDYKWEEEEERKLEMDELMASMEEMGMGGSLYSRDDMMRRMAEEYGMGDYGDYGYGGYPGGYGGGVPGAYGYGYGDYGADMADYEPGVGDYGAGYGGYDGQYGGDL